MTPICTFARLFVSCAQEQEMLRLHDLHEREMTKLRYELEQARTEGLRPTQQMCFGLCQLQGHQALAFAL